MMTDAAPAICLARSFLAQLSEPARSRMGQAARLKETVLELMASARATWPDIAVAADEFLPYLAQRVPTDARSACDLLAIKAEDLYLACACALGKPAALTAFDCAYLRDLERSIPRPLLERITPGDLHQLVRIKLFLSEGESPPRIVSYTGAGPLRRWVRMVAVRSLLDLRRSEKREPEVPLPRDENLPTATLDPELALLDAFCRAAFQAALAAAAASLSRSSRWLLGQHYLNGLTLDQIAIIQHVHRATVARRLARARAQLLAATRAALRKRLHLAPAEIESLVATAVHHVDMSMGELLKT